MKIVMNEWDLCELKQQAKKEHAHLSKIEDFEDNHLLGGDIREGRARCRERTHIRRCLHPADESTRSHHGEHPTIIMSAPAY